jgi:alpha-glucosidase
MLLLTLRGTPTLYYGDEIGMRDVEIPPDRVQDPFEKNLPGRGLGRDPERTPMQWNAEPNAGFTTGAPWLPISPDYAEVNVAAQRADPRSMLRLYSELIALRRGEPALEIGRFEPIQADGDVLAYVRRARREESHFLVALNLGQGAQTVRTQLAGTIALSTRLDRRDEPVRGPVELRPDEGVIVRLAL